MFIPHTHCDEANKSPNTNKCASLEIVCTIFYVVHTRFGAIFSPSSRSWHRLCMASVHTIQGRDPFASRKSRCFYAKNNYNWDKYNFNHYKKKITVIFTNILRLYTFFLCKILHYWYHNVCIFIVTYFIVRFKEMLVSAPWRLWDKSAETCKRLYIYF